MRLKRSSGGTAVQPPDPKVGVAFNAATAMRLALTAEGQPVYRRVVPVVRRTREAAPIAA